MGRQINVIVQLNPPSDVTMEATAEAASALPGFIQDPEFGVLSVPAAVIGFEAGIGAEAAAAEEEILITRGVIDENDLAQFQASVEASPQTRAIFSDPFIEPFLTCIGTPAVGSAADVETLLAVPSLAQAGMTGKNVAVAVVDTGINLQFLKTRVPGVKTDAGRSKAFGAPVTP
ncbi:MAG TPA: hypothetical protein VHK90_15960, partial [Thermoanaerobaculia bacterium]|nr:hypothetical protein [Thermoanaerobaculia bacterium]